MMTVYVHSAWNKYRIVSSYRIVKSVLTRQTYDRQNHSLHTHLQGVIVLLCL